MFLVETKGNRMKKEFLKDMAELKQKLLHIKYEFTNLCALGFRLDSDLFEAVDAISTFTIELLAQKYKIEKCDLLWQIHINDFGNKKYTLEKIRWMKSFKKIIASDEDFWDFIKDKSC